jgi:hypothetical protein
MHSSFFLIEIGRIKKISEFLNFIAAERFQNFYNRRKLQFSAKLKENFLKKHILIKNITDSEKKNEENFLCSCRIEVIIFTAVLQF